MMYHFIFGFVFSGGGGCSPSAGVALMFSSVIACQLGFPVFPTVCGGATPNSFRTAVRKPFMRAGNCVTLLPWSSRAIVTAFAIGSFLVLPCFGWLSKNLAGAEGFEPPSPVLETGSLAVELTPLIFQGLRNPLHFVQCASPSRFARAVRRSLRVSPDQQLAISR